MISLANIVGTNSSKDAIETQRQNNISRILRAINDYLASLEGPGALCSFECDVKMSGATRKQLRPMGLLITQEKLVFSQVTLDSIASMIRKCKPAVGPASKVCGCKILAPVIAVIDDIEKELGLRLEDLLSQGVDKTKPKTLTLNLPNTGVRRRTQLMLDRTEKVINDISREMQLLRAGLRAGKIRTFTCRY